MRPDPQETADFVTFTEEILHGKLQFLRSEDLQIYQITNGYNEVWTKITTFFKRRVSIIL